MLRQRSAPRVDYFNRVRLTIPEDRSTLDLFASNVSSGGMFVRSNRPLPAGKSCSLEFETKQGLVAVDEGVVVWSKPFDPINVDGSVPGMGLQFKKISKEAQSIVSAFVHEMLGEKKVEFPQSMKDSPLCDQRTAPRVGFQNKIRVLMPEKRIDLDVDASNISCGGIFLHQNPALAMGQKVALEFETKKGLIRIDEGEVVRTTPFETVNTDTSFPGTGVRFNSMSPESRARIETFIYEVLGEHHHHPEPVVLPPPLKRTFKTPVPPDAPLQSQTTPSWPAAQAEIASVPSPVSTIHARPSGQLTSPPTPRVTFLLFAGFVVFVAIATFVALLLIDPFSSREVPSRNDQTQKDEPPAAALPVEHNTQMPGATLELAGAFENAPKPEMPPTAAGPVADAAPVESQVNDIADGSPKRKDLSVGLAEIGLPVFFQESQGWSMVLKANGPIKVKYFQLDRPPRLVLDVRDASFSGLQTAMESPTSFIQRVRVGKKDDFMRFVIDFSSADFPDYQISIAADSVTVVFKI